MERASTPPICVADCLVAHCLHGALLLHYLQVSGVLDTVLFRQHEARADASNGNNFLRKFII